MFAVLWHSGNGSRLRFTLGLAVGFAPSAGSHATGGSVTDGREPFAAAGTVTGAAGDSGLKPGWSGGRAPGAAGATIAMGETIAVAAGITPGVATDAWGLIHLVYMRGAEIYYRQIDGSGKMGDIERVPAPPGNGELNSPHVVCDAAGNVHLVFTRDFTRYAQVGWYTNRRAGRWSVPVVALDETGTERRVNYPRLFVDGTTAYVGAFAIDGSRIAKLADTLSKPRVVAKIESRLWLAHPIVRGGEVLLIGRAAARGHMLDRYTRHLDPAGEPLLLSRGTPKKTGEPTAVYLDRRGVVHVAGVMAGGPNRLWYNSDARAASGADAVLGPEVGDDVREFTFPVLQEDAQDTLYMSYRDHASGEGRIVTIDAATGRFTEPVRFAPAITRRLRWNAPLAAAEGGGVYATWESDGRVYLRAIGVPSAK
jgi:hypothetical protein